MHSYFTEKGVHVTRAREYESNDNAHVEQNKRVMLSEHVSKKRKKALWRIHQQLNPVQLKKQEFLMRKQIDKAMKMLRKGVEPSQAILTPPPRDNTVSQFEVFKELNHANLKFLHIFQ